jgi:hypothetical protein
METQRSVQSNLAASHRPTGTGPDGGRAEFDRTFHYRMLNSVRLSSTTEEVDLDGTTRQNQKART